MFWDEIEREAAKPENARELDELRGLLGIKNAIAEAASVDMTQLTSKLAIFLGLTAAKPRLIERAEFETQAANTVVAGSFDDAQIHYNVLKNTYYATQDDAVVAVTMDEMVADDGHLEHVLIDTRMNRLRERAGVDKAHECIYISRNCLDFSLDFYDVEPQALDRGVFIVPLEDGRTLYFTEHGNGTIALYKAQQAHTESVDTTAVAPVFLKADEQQ